MDIRFLQQALQTADPAAFLVEPRILRRVIKQDRRLASLGFHVPHQHCYTIQRDRLLVIVERSELRLSPAAELPKNVILLAEPTEGDELDNAPREQVLHVYWRLLFHARVHLAIEQRIAEGKLDEAEAFRIRRDLGTTEFEEIRSVLQKDDLLLPPATDLQTYTEFVAVFLELHYFAPQDLPLYFPAIRDWSEVQRLVSRDVDHERLYWSTRLPGAPLKRHESDPLDERNTAGESERPETPGERTVPRAKLARMLARADRASNLGNDVRAAVLKLHAQKVAGAEEAAEIEQAVHAKLVNLARRLDAALGLDDAATEQWAEALAPLLEHAARDRWSSEARLLYDLQRVCLEHERGIYRVDLVGWALSLFRQPVRRGLPLLRPVMITKHLRSAARRLSVLQVAVSTRDQLRRLLDHAFAHMEAVMRADLRPRIAQVLDNVGLTPQNVPQQVARRKIIEELLDRIVEKGFLTMGDLRDRLSQNHLKLSDVSGIWEALKGDQLLRADRELAVALEGVYRPGAVYLRWPQRLSSLGFGTRFGRFLTQYVVLPYGGAFVAIEGLRHLIEVVQHSVQEAPPEPVVPETLPDPADVSLRESLEHLPEAHGWGPLFYAAVLTLGTLLLLLIHRPAFRRWMFQRLVQVGKWLRIVIIDWPRRLVGSPLVQRVLQSHVYAVVRSYLLRPAMFSTLVIMPLWLASGGMDVSWMLNIFLGLNLFLNSPIGRYADERVTDVLVRMWNELRIRVFAAAFNWIMDVFHQLLEAVERALYMVDEWLRFRRGDSRFFLLIKGFVGVIWSVVRYVIRIYVTLLIEPQVNPIKHFPVVTVSHKIMLPYVPLLTTLFAAPMEPFIGGLLAKSVAVATVFLLPGLFGFLVWELKENWRLFAANQSKTLVPNIIGHHGETMAGLLRPGFHSGTLPKQFARLRQAAREADVRADRKLVNRRLSAIHHLEEALRRFFDRELCVLLEEDGTLAEPPVRCGEIRLATNRIDVQFLRGDAEPAWLTIEERGGWLIGGLRRRGWIDELGPDEKRVWEAALAGTYKRAAVDLVREQLDAGIGSRPNWYDISAAGIALYTNGSPSARVLYPLRRGRTSITPEGESVKDRSDWPVLRREKIVFADTTITWVEWVAFWSSPHDQRPEPPGVLPGPEPLVSRVATLEA